jgi:hypothetical protein
MRSELEFQISPLGVSTRLEMRDNLSAEFGIECEKGSYILTKILFTIKV